MKLVQQILLAAVRLYRWILSPAKDALFGPSARCRFEPSCSAYALDALRTHGAGKGSWLAIKRVGRCHPWGAFGFDPVPPKQSIQALTSLPGATGDCTLLRPGPADAQKQLWRGKRARSGVVADCPDCI